MTHIKHRELCATMQRSLGTRVNMINRPICLYTKAGLCTRKCFCMKRYNETILCIHTNRNCLLWNFGTTVKNRCHHGGGSHRVQRGSGAKYETWNCSLVNFTRVDVRRGLHTEYTNTFDVRWKKLGTLRGHYFCTIEMTPPASPWYILKVGCSWSKCVAYSVRMFRLPSTSLGLLLKKSMWVARSRSFIITFAGPTTRVMICFRG